MWRLAIRNRQPRGRQFKYIQQESGFVMEAFSLEELKGKIIAHRKNMNYPIGSNFNAEVEDQVCRNLDPDQQEQFCKQAHEVNSPEEIRSRVLTAGDVTNFAQMVVEWRAEGSEYVDQTEANRRAQICSQCPLNIKMQGCNACRSAAKVVLGISGKSTPYDNQLQMCGVCHCSIPSAVWLPKDVQLKYLSEETKNAFPAQNCWKRPD